MKKAGVNEQALAGFDGFGYADAKNYFDESMANNINAQRKEQGYMLTIKQYDVNA